MYMYIHIHISKYKFPFKLTFWGLTVASPFFSRIYSRIELRTRFLRHFPLNFDTSPMEYPKKSEKEIRKTNQKNLLNGAPHQLPPMLRADASQRVLYKESQRVYEASQRVYKASQRVYDYI